MAKEDILRSLQGLIKKHGNQFSVKLKYKTANGKVKKRHGSFIELKGENELILFNEEKKAEGRYLIDFIERLSKG